MAPGDTTAGQSAGAPAGGAGESGSGEAGGQPLYASGETVGEEPSGEGGPGDGGEQADGEPPDGEVVDGEQVDGEVVDGEVVDGEQVNGEQAQQWETAASRSAIDRSGGAADTMLMTIYYLDDQTGGETLQPVEIKVPATITPVAEALRHLLHPPVELGLYGEFPPGTTAALPNLADGVVTVELSPEVEAVRGQAATHAVIASLVYTLTEIPGVDAVQLWVNGRPAELDGFVWSVPLSRADLENWNLFRVEPVISYSGA
ncbi:spore germination protein GerM [Symbiobacterium terraclitae]|uniref:Spore germination protein GerM n=1 Tax=Symbiobacterium terraclitae TaxID=557451 RepID=A0ABS4JSU4_9FIRM|nr:GerMN domain-containing protein [Symbiobacterium terraclitae]MBP2018045.1 spore germination protein GerM [Symbiobacterium terraclitae]